MSIDSTQRTDARRRHRRSGSLIVWCAFLLVVLLGMVGLVIDTGMLLAAHRHCQNAADAAAMAAAFERMYGGTDGAATTCAKTFVHSPDHNHLPDATVTVNIPPSAASAYEGASNYVEVHVENTINTYFIHVLPLLDGQSTVSARATAGYELVASGEGVLVLDPDAWPGLDVSGGGRLVVIGGIISNSEGGGVDENGDPSLMALAGHQQWSARGGQPNSEDGIYSDDIRVVGGVDTPGNFKHIDPAALVSPLRCNQLPVPDPFASLPTPTVNNGVVTDGIYDGRWGSVTVNNQGYAGPPGWQDPATGEVTMQPGIYDQIKINDGVVTMLPGIYVLSATKQNALTITGGQVTANGIMFYNTGENYEPATGWPDNTDPPDPLNLLPPPKQATTNFGDVTINASMQFSPIDTTTYDYPGATNISTFDHMLFYQRRLNDISVEVVGNADDGQLAGTLYSKWAPFKISGQGTYDAQFVVGSIAIPGQGDVTIHYTGDGVGKAPKIFLVE